MATKRPHSNTENAEKTKKPKIFDFSVHPMRKIAIQFFYLGWEHDGLVQQPGTPNTVEQHLMEALLMTKLIEDWNNCEFSRCGRTDKGVSAFRQTAALIVRSCCPSENGVFWPENCSESTKLNYENKKEELPYIRMLNGVLPKSIRVFSWAPVCREFNARFDCNRRTYKYAFPVAGMDLEKMRQAGKFLIGEHDFSNFCQIDMNEKRVQQTFTRKIYNVTVEKIPGRPNKDIYEMAELTVSGSGFLWHMIRFIVSVLHEIGQGNEKAEIIEEMLDLERFPSRPHYKMAADTPLCLFDCGYDNCQISWKTDEKVLNASIIILQKRWAAFQSRSRMMENMLEELTSMAPESMDLTKGLHEFIKDGPISMNYQKFENRPRCETIQVKKEKLAAMKERKIEENKGK